MEPAPGSGDRIPIASAGRRNSASDQIMTRDVNRFLDKIAEAGVSPRTINKGAPSPRSGVPPIS